MRLHRRRRTFVGARKPFAADEDDHTKMNAQVVKVWARPPELGYDIPGKGEISRALPWLLTAVPFSGCRFDEQRKVRLLASDNKMSINSNKTKDSSIS